MLGGWLGASQRSSLTALATKSASMLCKELCAAAADDGGDTLDHVAWLFFLNKVFPVSGGPPSTKDLSFLRIILLALHGLICSRHLILVLDLNLLLLVLVTFLDLDYDYLMILLFKAESFLLPSSKMGDSAGR